MARLKDINWNCGKDEREKNGCIESFGVHHSQLAVLMDIRDELKRLNNLLHCQNYTEIPRVLREIRRNTKRRKRKASQ